MPLHCYAEQCYAEHILVVILTFSYSYWRCQRIIIVNWNKLRDFLLVSTDGKDLTNKALPNKDLLGLRAANRSFRVDLLKRPKVLSAETVW